MNKNYNLNLKTFLFGIIILLTKTTIAQVPVADFKVCKKVIEQYDVLKFTDITTYSPYEWKWEVYDSVTYKNDLINGPVADINNGSVIADPNSNGKNENSQNPEFQFQLPGCYTIKLISRNMNGYSIPQVKKCYITVLSPYSVFLGFGKYTGMKMNFGKIIDNGGLNLNYGNNQGINTKSYFKILPTNGQNITINFKKIKLADAGDSIRIYDADTIVGGKLLKVIKNTDNGKNLSIVSTSPKMFVIFNSNASGVDSGFYAEFYTYNNPFLGINKTIKKVKNFIAQPSVFVNDNIGFVYTKNYTREWYVNGVLQPIYNDKDTLNYTFYNANNYEIKLKITPLCDTSSQTIITGNSTVGLANVYQTKTSVFPNPTKGILNVNFEYPISELTKIELMNMEGKVIAEIETNLQLNQLNASHLSKGIYVLKISNIDGINTHKIIVN